MILVLAPYAPLGMSPEPHLGAARKLEAVLGVLGRIDAELVLVNSAHNRRAASWYRRTPWNWSELQIAGRAVRQLELPCAAQSTLGKAWNLLDVGAAVRALAGLGRPQLIWIYNPYAFEAELALRLLRQFEVPALLEFEDAPLARPRGWNPKPRLDARAARRLLPRLSAGFAVNASLADSLRLLGVDAHPLPGLVPDALMAAAQLRPAFSDPGVMKVGYFGGLTPEKGANLILDAIELGGAWRWIVSGAGVLEPAFRAMAQRYPQRLDFEARVPEQRLYARIAGCDVMVNPHCPIADLGDGVFPFKVIESLASGRLLVSTALPDPGAAGLLDAVQWFDGTAQGLMPVLASAGQRFREDRDKIVQAAQRCQDSFGEAALERQVRRYLNRQG
jgi:glycosyltransferase involved in cell wall biosynthesis